MNDQKRAYQYLTIAAVLAALVLAIAIAYATPWPEVWWLVLVLLTLVCGGVALWPFEKGPAEQDREAMLQRVRKGWVDGVLEQSLYKTARLDSVLETSPDSVEPWNPDAPAEQEPHPLPAGTRIRTVFEDANASLAILGEAGSGKTTLLLELARDLIQEAETESSRPIPVVFNLSSWANHCPPLERWLVCELTRRYHVPRETARAWVECDQIAPLLDGLEEVPENDREACVEAINAFARRHETAPLAVCCGSAEYERLSTRLTANHAVVIQPLTREQVSDYLEQAGDELAGVREALEADEALLELIRTPLMLWMASLAYRECPAEEVRLSGLSEEQQQKLVSAYAGDTLQQGQQAEEELSYDTEQMTTWMLFSAYANAVFGRRDQTTGELAYDKEQTITWLQWLASLKKNQNQTTLFLEDLKPHWLSGATTYTVVLPLLYGVLWAVFGVAAGGITEPWRAVAGAVLYGLLGALLYGLCGLEYKREASVVPARAWPNEGVWRSAWNAVRVALPAGVGVFLFVGLLQGARNAAPSGLFFGLLAGVVGGGMPVLHHLSLRIALWLNGQAPLRYVRFLEHAADLRVLQRVGGGYAFAHGILLEHFASAKPLLALADEEEPSAEEEAAEEPPAALETEASEQSVAEEPPPASEREASEAVEPDDESRAADDVTEEAEEPEEEAAEETVDVSEEPEEEPSESAGVNINTASLDELTRIRHIGPTRAEQLIELRPFESLDQLTRIDGIGPAALRDIREEGVAYVE